MSTAVIAAAIVLLPARRTTPVKMMKFTRRLNMTSCNYSSSSSSTSKKQLILYSKPGCCLCDGLKEKLYSTFSISSLHDVDLQGFFLDITSNPDWERAYQYEIPVLARLRSDGSEEVIPRFSPRAGVDHIQTKLAAVLSQDN